MGQTRQATIVSLTATGTVDDHLKNIRCRKTKVIKRVDKASKRKTIEALLMLFEETKNDSVFSESEWRGIEHEDDLL